MVKPKASSTPKFVDVRGRRPIGEVTDDSVDSPIFSRLYKSEIPERNRDLKYDSGKSDDDDDDFNEETEISTEEAIENTTFCNCLNLPSIIMLSAFIILAAILYVQTEERNNISIESLSKEFPSQVEDFWISIETGIKDIKQLQQPKTFVFLYNDESHRTLEKILHQVTEFATCILTNCTSVPVILEARDLNDADILNDYGQIITRNKEKLEESGVMIVKNLEKVAGVSAQAFHSLCDEYYPVVKNALFIFTMKVDKFHDNNIKFMEKYLHNRWKDIKDDTFSALFTRIANTVLPIMAEK